MECLIQSIVHLSKFPRHQAAEKKIGTLQHLGTGTEILSEEDPSRFPVRRLVSRLKTPVLSQKYGGIGQPETIDGLLDIPHHKEFFPLLGHCLKNGVLDFIGILVLVDHYLCKTARYYFRQLRGLPCIIPQQLNSHMLQVREIQASPLTFQSGIYLVKIMH